MPTARRTRLLLVTVNTVTGALATPPTRRGVMHMPRPQPLLSITMPTRNRPQLLERALRSVVGAVARVARHVEVAVSDGSDDEASGQVVHRLPPGQPVRSR